MGKTARTSILTAILLALLVFATAGCSTLGNGKIDASPRTEALVRATVRYAVMRAIGTDIERAERIAHIAGEAIGLAKSDAVTTADRLEAAVREHLELDTLSPENRAIAEALISVVRAEVEQLLEGRTIDGDAVFEVVTLLTWVQQAAQRAES